MRVALLTCFLCKQEVKRRSVWEEEEDWRSCRQKQAGAGEGGGIRGKLTPLPVSVCNNSRGFSIVEAAGIENASEHPPPFCSLESREGIRIISGASP